MASNVQSKTVSITGSLSDSVVLIIVNIKNYQSTINSIVKKTVQDNKTPGVYINLNKPYDVVTKNLEKGGVNTNSLIFIDSVTAIRDESHRSDNCLYLGHHQNLTDISIATSEAIMAIPSEKKVLFLDSINNLLIYNDHNTVLRFSRFLIGKVRSWKCGAVIFAVKEKNSEDLIKELSQATDTVLDLGGEK